MRNMMTGKHARRQAYGKLAWPGVLPLFFAAVALLCCSSCSEEDDTGTGTSSDTTDTDIEINLTLRTYKMATTAESDDYEVGSTYENYIDIAGGDYKIYFFTNNAGDGNDTYLATFDSTNELVPVMSSDYTEYTLLGKVPEDFAEYVNGEGNGDFKVVVLANWGGSYPSPTEGTTINGICTDDAGIYTHKETSDFVLGESNLIPFYGVHEYTGQEFKQGMATILDDPITLLRAMAKVEVVFEDDYYQSFDDVKIHRYNDKGYCAPSGVYKQADYDSKYTDWSSDFVSELHLVGGANDKDVEENPEEKELVFLKTQEYSNEDENYETWIAYVPEYSNTNVDNEDDYSYIEVMLQGIPYYIYFANYNESGQTNNSDTTKRYDIERNNLYRFIVSFDEQTLKVHVNKWDDEYENEFEFGTDTGTDD